MARPFSKVILVAASLAGQAAAAPAMAEEPDISLARAAALFKAAKSGECADSAFERDRLEAPDVFPVTYRSAYAAGDEPDRTITLYQFYCDSFAHAGSSVFVSVDQEGQAELMTFAVPFVMRDLSAPGDNKPLVLLGFAAQTSLQNAEFDAATLELATTNFSGNTEYFSNYRLIEGVFVFQSDQTWAIRDGALMRTPPQEEE